MVGVDGFRRRRFRSGEGDWWFRSREIGEGNLRFRLRGIGGLG